MALARVKSRALVVEDQPHVAAIIEGLLQRIGFDITIARTGTEAMRLARGHEFDLVTLDLDLPDISGLEVCAYLKEDFRFGRTSIIFVSGQFTAEDRRRGVEAGGADFILKPFDAYTFVSRILCHVKPK